MSMKKVEQFFKLIEGNEVLAKRLAKINEELKNESEEFLNCEQAINEKIIPFAEENGVSFTAKDFLDYTNSKLPPELTREDLLNVSGGVSPKTFAITLGALLTLPFASGSLISFADDGIGSSAPQQIQTQATTQNAANDEAEQKTFKYEQLWFSGHRSDEAIKNNLVNFINKNNIESYGQIGNLSAFMDDANRIGPDINKDSITGFYYINGGFPDEMQSNALRLIKKAFLREVEKSAAEDYTPISIKEENEGKVTSAKKLDYLYEVTKHIRSINEVRNGSLGDLMGDIYDVLDEVEETRANSYKVQHLRNLYNEYEKNYSAKDFTRSPEGASLKERINNVYEFISSSLNVTKKTEEDLKDETMDILSRVIDPHTGKIREDPYINLVGKENFERILEDLKKISDPETWQEEMKKLNKEEDDFASKLEKIKKHFNSNYAVRYNPSSRFENLSPIEQLHDLYSVVSKCGSIVEVHNATVKDLIENIKMFIGEIWNANTKTLEMSGTLNTETLQELKAVQKFAKKSGIPFTAKLNKIPNNPNAAEIFDILLEISRRINTTNDLHYNDAKEYKKWVEFLAWHYYNPRLEDFEVPGAEGINGRQIVDVCKNSGIKLTVGENNSDIQKDDITGRFNKLARVLNRASSVDDLTDLEGIKKELQDLLNGFYNAKGERFEIPITKLRGNKAVVVGAVSPQNGQTIINECKRLGIELKIDFRKFPERLSGEQKFSYVEAIAKRINSTDDLTETGKKAFESAGTELIKFLQTVKNSGNSEQYKQYAQLYNKSELKRVYENSKNWPIIYFSPDKEMSQMGKIYYLAKFLEMCINGERKFEDPNDSEENFEGKRRTDAHEDFIYDVLKLGGTHYNAKTGVFNITDGSYFSITDEENAKYNINTVKNFYKIITIGDPNTQIKAVKLAQYKRSGRTLVQIAQNLVDRLEEQGWNWAAFSPETLPNLISDLKKVVSRIERGINELYFLNDAWWGTNENTSINSKNLEKLKEVLADYNSWL